MRLALVVVAGAIIGIRAEPAGACSIVRGDDATRIPQLETEPMPPVRVVSPIVDVACSERIADVRGTMLAEDRGGPDAGTLAELRALVRDARWWDVGCRVMADALVTRVAASARHACGGDWMPVAVDLWDLAARAATTAGRREVAERNRRTVARNLDVIARATRSAR